jgi:hypothetical protein
MRLTIEKKESKKRITFCMKMQRKKCKIQADNQNLQARLEREAMMKDAREMRENDQRC